MRLEGGLGGGGGGGRLGGGGRGAREGVLGERVHQGEHFSGRFERLSC